MNKNCDYRYHQVEKPVCEGWWFIDRPHHKELFVTLLTIVDGKLKSCTPYLQKYIDKSYWRVTWTGPIPSPEHTSLGLGEE